MLSIARKHLYLYGPYLIVLWYATTCVASSTPELCAYCTFLGPQGQVRCDATTFIMQGADSDDALRRHQSNLFSHRMIELHAMHRQEHHRENHTSKTMRQSGMVAKIDECQQKRSLESVHKVGTILLFLLPSLLPSYLPPSHPAHKYYVSTYTPPQDALVH